MWSNASPILSVTFSWKKTSVSSEAAPDKTSVSCQTYVVSSSW